jgi:hypothetical protein
VTNSRVGHVVDLRLVENPVLGAGAVDSASLDAAQLDAAQLYAASAGFASDRSVFDEHPRLEVPREDRLQPAVVARAPHVVEVPAQRRRPGATQESADPRDGARVHLRLEELRPEDLRLDDLRLEELRPEDLRLDDLRLEELRPEDLRPDANDPTWLGLGLFGSATSGAGATGADAVRAGASAVGWTPTVDARPRSGSKVPATVAGLTVAGLILGVAAFGTFRGPSSDDVGAVASVVPLASVATTTPSVAPLPATSERPSSTLTTATAAKISKVNAPPVRPVATTSSTKASSSRTAAPRPTSARSTTAPAGPDPSTSSTSGATRYPNCGALNADFPHGVARSGGKDKTSGTPVTTFVVNDAVYAANTRRDFDKDGVACERA